MDYYRRYVGDYLRDTARLSMLEHGAYTLLMDYYYAGDHALPADKDEIYIMVRAMTPADRKAVDKVLSVYFSLEPDGYHQGRIDRELARAHDASESAKKAGEKGAATRWKKGKPPPDDGGDDGDRYSGGNGEPYDEPNGEPNSGRHDGTNGETVAGRIPTRGGDPTTNHQPPTPNRQPPASLDTSPKPDGGEARATRLPPHWAPSESLLGWTRSERSEMTGDRARHEVAQFVDHYLGTGEKRADWDAAWRKWVRGIRDRDRGHRSSIRTDPEAMDLLLGNHDAAH